MFNSGAINNSATIDALNDVTATLSGVDTSLDNKINTNTSNLQNSINANMPVGSVIARGASVTPAGFLACNGSAVSRTTYSALFDVIGTRFGAGNGSTTFNLPNLSSARMVTSATVGVKGNGKTLGLTNGTQNLSFNVSGSDNNSKAYSTNAFNIAPQESSTGDQYTYGVFGVVQNTSTSGLTGTASLAQDLDYFIKY